MGGAADKGCSRCMEGCPAACAGWSANITDPRWGIWARASLGAAVRASPPPGVPTRPNGKQGGSALQLGLAGRTCCPSPEEQHRHLVGVAVANVVVEQCYCRGVATGWAAGLGGAG